MIQKIKFDDYSKRTRRASTSLSFKARYNVIYCYKEIYIQKYKIVNDVSNAQNIARSFNYNNFYHTLSPLYT